MKVPFTGSGMDFNAGPDVGGDSWASADQTTPSGFSGTGFSGAGFSGTGLPGSGSQRIVFPGPLSGARPSSAPMVIPCSMIGVWHYQKQTWEADMGITWFDARARTIEIIYRPAGHTGTFQYSGNHFSPRDRWVRPLRELPYTDLPLDMAALAEQILPWFPPLDGSPSSSRHRMWQEGHLLGLHWQIWFIASGRTYPLARHGWHLNFVQEGLTKSWKTT